MSPERFHDRGATRRSLVDPHPPAAHLADQLANTVGRGLTRRPRVGRPAARALNPIGLPRVHIVAVDGPSVPRRRGRARRSDSQSTRSGNLLESPAGTSEEERRARGDDVDSRRRPADLPTVPEQPLMDVRRLPDDRRRPRVRTGVHCPVAVVRGVRTSDAQHAGRPKHRRSSDHEVHVDRPDGPLVTDHVTADVRPGHGRHWSAGLRRGACGRAGQDDGHRRVRSRARHGKIDGLLIGRLLARNDPEILLDYIESRLLSWRRSGSATPQRRPARGSRNMRCSGASSPPINCRSRTPKPCRR